MPIIPRNNFESYIMLYQCRSFCYAGNGSQLRCYQVPQWLRIAPHLDSSIMHAVSLLGFAHRRGVKLLTMRDHHGNARHHQEVLACWTGIRDKLNAGQLATLTRTAAAQIGKNVSLRVCTCCTAAYSTVYRSVRVATSATI